MVVDFHDCKIPDVTKVVKFCLDENQYLWKTCRTKKTVKSGCKISVRTVANKSIKDILIIKSAKDRQFELPYVHKN